MSDELRAVALQYLDALYDGDVALFRQVFHPLAMLFTVDDATLATLTLDQYMQRVAGRPSPRSRGDCRHDEIVAIEQASSTTATICLRNSYLPFRFVDILSLVRIERRWLIAAKVWQSHSDPG